LGKNNKNEFERMKRRVCAKNFDVEHPSWRVYTKSMSVLQRGNQSRPTRFFALLKIAERPGFGLYSHHQAV
jgi:hypothetical protein